MEQRLQQCSQPKRIAAFRNIARALVPNAMLIPMSERDLKSFLHHGELVSRIQIDRLNKKGGSVDPGYYLRVSVKKGVGTGSADSGAAEFTLLRQRGGIRTWKRLDHIVAWTQRTLPKLNLSVIELLVARAR